MLPKPGKIISLDLGTRRTGVAVSDATQSVAFARPEIEHSSDPALLAALKTLAAAELAVGFLLGRPTKLSGEATEQTEKVEALGQKIAALGLPIEFTDERLSTQFAQDLHGFKTDEKHHDSRAAQILMETYLSQ